MNIIVSNSKTADYLKYLNINQLLIDVHSNATKCLTVVDSRLTLLNNPHSLSIDFNSQDILSRIDPKSKKCSIVQAVEGRTKDKLKILDATAGLGRDTFTLASRGHSVIAIEKDPYIRFR